MSTTRTIPPPPEPAGQLDPKVAASYSQLYRDAEDPFSLKYLIDEANRLSLRPLREDATLLLHINFSGMIFLPVTMAEKVSADTLYDAVRDDITTVVNTAAQIAVDPVISGHQVINALTLVWGQLKTTAYNLWD